MASKRSHFLTPGAVVLVSDLLGLLCWGALFGQFCVPGFPRQQALCVGFLCHKMLDDLAFSLETRRHRKQPLNEKPCA